MPVILNLIRESLKPVTVGAVGGGASVSLRSPFSVFSKQIVS